MLFSTFIASSEHFAPEVFAKEHRLGEVSIWHKGTVTRRGKTHADSGFSMSLPDQDFANTAKAIIETFLEKNAGWLGLLRDQSVLLELRLGFTVGSDQAFIDEITLPAGLMQKLADQHIDLAIAAYPATD